MEALEAGPKLFGGRKFPELSTQSMGVSGVRAEAAQPPGPSDPSSCAEACQRGSSNSQVPEQGLSCPR